ncbi:hypothetical protein KBC79_03080 [Candidatus Woesebacteria bacterium]|nr:hypothetical protein [Candidatus Woesebacteria bacterium]
MKDRYPADGEKQPVSKREFLRYLGYMATGGALVAFQGLFKIPFVGSVLKSEKEASKSRPRDGELTLYRINPVKAEAQGAEYVRPFEDAFLPEMRMLSAQRQQILAQIDKLAQEWKKRYRDSDGDWAEPLGMQEYYEVIAQIQKVFADSTIDSLAQTRTSYPVDHFESTNDDVYIEPYKPEFQKRYEEKVAKINTASYALIGGMVVNGIAEYFGVFPGMPENGRWERLSGGAHEILLKKIANSGLPPKEAIATMAEAFIEHLKDRGIFDVLQFALLHQVVRRNNEKDWVAQYASEEEYTRAFKDSAFSHVAALSAVDAADELGLPTPLELRELEQTFMKDQPSLNVLGFGGYGPNTVDFAAMRNNIAQAVTAYSSALETTIDTRQRYIKDILIADKLNGFQRDRATSVLQPAEGNFARLIMALIIELASGPGSILHRGGYEAVVRRLFG